MTSCYEAPWKNSPFRGNPHLQYCTIDELEMQNSKLAFLIETYGETFDDEWWYFFNKKMTHVKRQPIWQTTKRIDCEKPKKYEPNRKLEEFKKSRGAKKE